MRREGDVHRGPTMPCTGLSVRVGLAALLVLASCERDALPPNDSSKTNCSPVGDWRVVAHFDTGADTGGFHSMWGFRHDDVWAGAGDRTIAHWNGRTWTKAATAGGTVRQISGTSASDVYFAGDGPLLHWNGKNFEVVPMPAPGRYSGAVYAAGPSDIWMSSEFLGDHALHLNEQSGQVSSWPLPLVAMQFGGTGPSDVWVVGLPRSMWEPGRAEVMHWDGVAWSVLLSSEQASDKFGWWPDCVWARDRSDVWVGGTDPLFHWDGKIFSPVVTPTDAYWVGLWGSVKDDVWAVGYERSRQGDPGIMMHWSGTSWTRVDPGVSDCIFAVWGFGCNDVWIGTCGGDLLHHG